EQGDFLFAGVVARDAVVFLLLLVDFLRDGEWINIHRDGEVQEAKIREPLDDSRIRRARPASQNDKRVIVSIEEETEVTLPTALAVPAILLNRKFGNKSVSWVVVKTVVERGIEETLVVAEVVKVGHRQNPCAART